MDYAKSIGHIVIVFLLFGTIEASEPRCLSRFDYDEKMLLKLLRFEDTIEKFNRKITDMMNTFEDNERKRNSVTKEAADEAKLKTKQIMDEIKQNTSNVLMNDSRNLRTQMQEVETLRAQMRGEMNNLQSAIALNKKENAAIAFTAYGPVGSPVRFGTVLTNIGGHYYQTTGNFNCTVPGLYYFTFHLVKLRSSTVDSCSCNLGKNGQSVGIMAYIDPEDYSSTTGGADAGSYGVSSGANLHLIRGDTVQLVSCSAVDKFENRSSFSGVLIKAD
ncbi:uncharacterized protein LOC127838891 [Dreissena polymorpha]|uniref:C1q domain-containing protein n=1 Tax=Dreissena polymorpha TaxID=45954 RepID=A0A9D4FLD1_DREPO|nr:uncharacterized protein LOC127838891 [Dreissena polymorpha]KAH3800935.1 hypothetical protein DPMN_154578 [Dreissena polymorpha]